MADNAPVDKGSKEATFTALAADFKLDDKVRGLFLGGPMENLEDFRYYFAGEKEIDAFVATEESLKEPEQRIQIARVRRAWAAVRQNGLRKENCDTISSVAELDDLLEEGTLREVKVRFWKRYKAKYPVEVNPSDQLLSRCHREMEAERERVSTWRAANLLLDDLDFAYVYTDFEEAYSHAGRAVAMAWSKAKILAEPEMVSDMAKIGAVGATATKIRKVDEQKKAAVARRKKTADVSFLRQPGKGTEAEEWDDDKARFIEPMAQLMRDCGVGHAENVSATKEEIMNSLRRKATYVVGAAGFSTLRRARTTADEFRNFLGNTAMHMGVDKVEPIALEEFLWQSRARVHAVKAVCWMCENLHLGWPIDRVEWPETEMGSLTGMECKQAPAAQPGMIKALTDCLVTAAETDDPTWLALLASWIQAMANLSFSHIVSRSVPVELYGGWMSFFCKRARPKRNGCHSSASERGGFHWGVPSETSCGYDWTVKFLKEYDTRRRSEVGEEMMGMIFRTDNFEYLPAREVNALTMSAVAGVIKNPGLLTTCNWRRLLPAAALHLNFSMAERLAIGDWGEAEARGEEAPITLRYAKGKEGENRTCQLICAAVFSSLASNNISTFDEIPAQQWAVLAEEARTKVESKPFEANAVWRSPESYLPWECRNTKRHAASGEMNLEGSPAQKKTKVEGPVNQPEAGRASIGRQLTSKAMPSRRGDKGSMREHVEDDSIMRKLLPRLRGEKDDRRGNRLNPEVPRLGAKVARKKAGVNSGLDHSPRCRGSIRSTRQRTSSTH